MTRYVLTDGMKSIDLPQYPDSAWNFASGAPEAIDADLYAKVAPVFRAVNLDANVKAGVPFVLTNIKSGKEYDTSADWQNNCGFLPNPSQLFKQWFMSLSMTNSAYGFMERKPRNLRYLVPTTITPEQSRDFPYALTGLKRTLGTSSKTYSVDDNIIIYIWRLDHTTELLPSVNTEFKAMASAAGILYYADYFVENYFLRGGIRPTIVAIKGQVSNETKKDIETTWDKFVRNVSKLRAKVINADAIDIKPFGDGVSDIKNNDTFREQCQKIAMAKGMPLSMLLSDYDNYSTAQVYDTAWFRDDIFPFCEWFAHEMNERVWEPFVGVRMEYSPEQTDQGTQDEVDRAAAFNTFADALGKYPDAATFLAAATTFGFELSDKLIAAVTKHYAPKEQPASVTVTTPPTTAPSTTDTTNTPVPEFQPATVTKFVPNPDQLGELDFWKKLAFRKFKKGDSLLFPFEIRALPQDVGETIRSKLGWANSQAEIKSAFDLTDAVLLPVFANDIGDELRELTKALNSAADGMKAKRE